MCIAFFNLSLPGYKLALASNRDEFLARDTRPAAWHAGGNNDGCRILSGIDVAGGVGGTWLGVSATGRLGVLLNIRDEINPPRPPTRGLLVKRYLSNEDIEPEELQAYEGCNLLTFDVSSSGNVKGEVLSNRGSGRVWVESNGWAGISNSPVQEPWPKVVEGVEALEGLENAEGGEDEVVNGLFGVLQRSVPLLEFEDRMRATFIPPINVASGEAGQAKWYGTRVSTVVLVRDDGTVLFIERDMLELDDQGSWRRGTGERKFDITL